MRHLFHTTFRSLLRDRYFTLINVFGLAIGLACSLLVGGYVQHQLSYDQTHPAANRLYRVNQTNIWVPEGGVMSSTSLPLADVLKNEHPQIEDAMRINTPGTTLVRYLDGRQVRAHYEESIFGADENFFSFFDFALQAGDAETALKGKNKVVLSPEAARRYFGDESALGKILHVGDEQIPVEVTGVTLPQNDNSHFQFDLLLSLYTNPLIEDFEWSWIWTQVVTYCRLKEDADVRAVQANFKGMAARHVAPTFGAFGIDFDDFMSGKGEWDFTLQPVTDIYLHSASIGNRVGPVGDIRYVYIFGFTGIFVFFLAIINYINLSTATASMRAKEVGIKKALGAARSKLVLQFLGEATLLSIAATLLGLSFLELLRMYASSILGIVIPMQLFSPGGLVILLLVPLITGLLAGSYPAGVLTSFQPVNVLKGRVWGGNSRSGLRTTLIVFQFFTSLVFISASIVVFQQLRFLRERDLGFQKENLLVVNHAEKAGHQLASFRDEAANIPGVEAVSVSMDVPGRGPFEDVFTRAGSDAKYPLSVMKMDDRFLDVLDIELVAGNGFRLDQHPDANSVIINEVAARFMGWSPAEAVGKTIHYMGDDIGPQTVAGVVKDFHFQSLHTTIAPVIFFHVNSNMGGARRVLSVRFAADALPQVRKALEELWVKRTQDAPFEYSILHDEWVRKYQTEERLGSLFALFAGLSITIAMIGLVGLVAYSAERRRKEIGIRKVMGATAWQVVAMLNGRFTRLMVISLLLAVPVSWYAMDLWLQKFPYHSEQHYSTHIAAAIILLAITWLTVSFQSVRAAVTNPADVLKEE